VLLFVKKPENSGIWLVFINHKGKRKARKIGRSKWLAKDVAQRINAQIKLGDLGFVDGKPYSTFGEYATTYMTVTLSATCKMSTKVNYISILQKHVLPVFGSTIISDMNRFTIKKFLMEKLNTGYSQSTANHIKCAIGNVLNLAIDDEIFFMNPSYKLGNIYNKQKLDSAGVAVTIIDPLSREELSLLLQTFKDNFPIHYPITLTLARTGMRAGEVFGLQFSDIDFNNRLITVQRSYTKGRIETPKNGKFRRMDMSLQLKETLCKLKQYLNQKMGNDMPEWIIFNKYRKPILVDNWRKRIFYPTLRETGLRQIRIHDLRHTYASLLLAAGESMIYVKEQLGHSSIKVTVDIYGHPLQETFKLICFSIRKTNQNFLLKYSC